MFFDTSLAWDKEKNSVSLLNNIVVIVDMLPVSPESTPEGPGTTGNQEDVMATENTGLRTPLETNSCKDSAVQVHNCYV